VTVHGDQLHFFDVPRLIEFHERVGALVTLVLKANTLDKAEEGDLAEIDPATNKILRWHQRPHSLDTFGGNLYLNGGLAIYSKKVLEHIPGLTPVSLDRDIIPRLIEKRFPVYGFPSHEEMLDIGTMDRYERAKSKYPELKRAYEKKHPRVV
jgi:mannose-1-phosphate guanylyltransferase